MNPFKSAKGLIHHTIVLLAGLTSVCVLSMTDRIHDGETIAALSAVLSTAIGTQAVQRGDTPSDGGKPDA